MRLKPAALLALLGMSAPALAGELSLKTDDGTTLHATSWGDGPRAVLLVHDVGRSSSDWGALGERLAGAGFLALALDLRGHGRSGETVEIDVQALVTDVRAGLGWLAGAGAQEVHVVGAGLGGPLSLATEDPSILDVIALSPPLRSHGVTVSTAAAALGSRSLLVVASETDPAGAKAAAYLGKQATGPHHVQIYPASASGARLLNAEPTLEPLLLSWLHRTHPAWASSRPTEPPAVQSRGVTEIEATGRRFEDR